MLNRRMNLFLYTGMMPALFSVCILIDIVLGTREFLSISCFGIVFFHVVTILQSIRYTGFSLYTLYLLTAFFFIYSRFFFSLIKLQDFLYIDFPGVRRFSPTTGIILLCEVFVSHYILAIYMILNHKKKQIVELKRSTNFEIIGLFLMTLSFPLILYKLFLQLMVIKQTRYVSIFTGALSNIQYPFWTKGSGTLFYTGFLFLLMSRPGKKQFIYGSFLFFMFFFVEALKGGRGGLVASCLSILYFYKFFYKKRISFSRITLIFLVLLSFCLVIGQTRNSDGSSFKLGSKVIVNFAIGQSQSIGSPLGIIEFDGQREFRKYPYIFSVLLEPVYNILYPETVKRPSVERLYIRNENEGIITYLYSHYMYLNGFGIGSSFLGEMHDFFGFFGVIFWTVVLAKTICFVESKMKKNRNFIFISWFVINSVLLLPRAHFFAFVTSALPYVLPCGVCFIMSKMFLLSAKQNFIRRFP